MIFKAIKSFFAEAHTKQTCQNIFLSKDFIVTCHSETWQIWLLILEKCCGIAEAKKVMLLQKIFEPIAQWVQGWWKGEEVRTWGDTFVWHLNWDKCPRLFSCWTSEKKSRRWENGTLNNFKLQEFGLTL